MKTRTDASIGELMSQLSAQTSRLVRDEMRLAQKEFQESAKHAGIGAGLLSVGGLLAFFGATALVGACVAAIALVLPVWAAALIVGGGLLFAAGLAALISKRQIGGVSPPRETVASLRQDITEVKEARHGHA